MNITIAPETHAQTTSDILAREFPSPCRPCLQEEVGKPIMKPPHSSTISESPSQHATTRYSSLKSRPKKLGGWNKALTGLAAAANETNVSVVRAAVINNGFARNKSVDQLMLRVWFLFHHYSLPWSLSLSLPPSLLLINKLSYLQYFTSQDSFKLLL